MCVSDNTNEAFCNKKIYTQSNKIQVSVLDIRVNYNDPYNERSIKLYYESDEKRHTNIIMPNNIQMKMMLVPKINWYNQYKGIDLK